MRPSLTALSSLILLLPLFGCPPADDEKDTDDTNVDTDVEDEPDFPAYSFAGSVTVNSVVDGAVVCDADATLTGSNYTGDCDDCDFALDIVDDVTRNDGTADCGFFSEHTFIEGGGYYDILMASAAEYAGYSYDYTNALLFGYSYAGTYDYPGPYFTGAAYDGAPYSTWTRTGDDISWSYDYTGTYNSYAYNSIEDCDTYVASETKEGFGGTGGTSTLTCAKVEVIDIWTFVADGEPITVTIDTVAAETAFDPYLWLNDADGCTISGADDSFTCTFPPPTYACPSAAVDAGKVGDVYSVIVGSWSDCAGSTAEYEIRVTGGTKVTLAQDDVEAILATPHDITISVAGSGTLTPE